ncbi:MAG: hypothetical protein QM684_21790 [Rhizobium sp.]|uniref:hypothetical protein n=1 Tax=Rhizobium sp. SYY.PMSO TaxID=3382192 RepID=UPI0013B0008B
MRKILVICGALIWGFCPAFADELSPEMKQYVAAIFTDQNLLMREFSSYSARFPIQSSYFVGLFATNACNSPQPSKKLERLVVANGFLKSDEGQKLFILAGAVSTMTYPTQEQKDGFCQSAKHLLDVGENYAADNQ